MVQTEQVQSTTTITSSTTGTLPNASNVEVIRNEPIMKTIHEAPVVENIIEKKNIEIHNRNVVKEVHEQPIIEIERRPEVKIVEQQAVSNKVVAPTKYEEIGERTLPNVTLPVQTQGNVVPTVENSVVENTLPPIIEKVIEHPVYKQVIIEQHEIPIQTVYTTVPVIHAQQQETVLEQNTFQFRQMNTELAGIQTVQQQQPLLQQQTLVSQQQTVQQQPLLQQQTLQQGFQQGANLDKLRLVRSGYGKSVWGLSYGNELFRMSRQRKLGMMWERFAFWEGATTGFRFQDFSVMKGGYLWLLGLADRMLYLLDPSSRHEGMLRPMLQSTVGLPKFTHLSGYDSTHCYLLAEDGSVYLYDNGKLLRLNGQLKSLSSGNPKRFFGKSFELWGINFENRAMRWNGVDSWLDTGLVVRDIAVGVDNCVYAIDANGQLIKWVHNANHFEAVRTKFANETGLSTMQFQGVSAFKEHRGVYTVDNAGNVYEMDV